MTGDGAGVPRRLVAPPAIETCYRITTACRVAENPSADMRTEYAPTGSERRRSFVPSHITS